MVCDFGWHLVPVVRIGKSKQVFREPMQARLPKKNIRWVLLKHMFYVMSCECLIKTFGEFVFLTA